MGLRIAVDFDGTIVEHRYPNIGKAVPGAFKWLKRFKEASAILILWTMRSDGPAFGPTLTEAVDYCRRNGVEFDAVNQGIGDREWTDSPKVYANIYIDDAAFGCPLKQTPGCRRRVDWRKVGPAVMKQLQVPANT